jgi:hypothetical protein
MQMIKRIFQDHWEKYQGFHGDTLREVEIREVDRMLHCKDPERGFTSYRCPECGEVKILGFTCKSRMCTSCGKKYADIWAEKLAGDIYRLPHKHVVLTIPEQLREYYARDRSLLKVLIDSAARLIKNFVETRWKGSKVRPGAICVLHTFGSDIKFNPHIHVMATEGGIDEEGKWHGLRFFANTVLRKTWQYELLTSMKKAVPTREMSNLVDYLFKRYPKGFYVKPKKSGISATRTTRYIARYVRHPPMADSRIKGYDGEMVTFEYIDYRDKKKRKTKTLHAMEFISQVIMHIPEKHFRMVRHYGIYARNLKKVVRKIMAKLGKLAKVVKKEAEKVLESVKVKCDVCGAIMEIEGRWFPS